jgi:dolichol-phosphate mannosyltransferase
MLFWFLGALQIILGVRVILRLIRSGGGVRIDAATAPPSERLSIIVPVLNETARINPCLDSLVTQSESVAEILVVDGGSSDGTQAIVESYGLHDRRVRLIDASPVPSDRAGKTWGLYVGLKNTDPGSRWVLFIDADVRYTPLLAPSLLAHAEQTGISTFSVAAHQQLSSLADGLLHPSLLTTLVYRFGIPPKPDFVTLRTIVGQPD